MKYFVISDVHSFYQPMIDALNKAGFDPNNENHTLVSCGDLFDRGDDSVKVLDYIMSLPRKVLVQGNHESMLIELLTHKRGPQWHDEHNGTLKTIEDLGGAEDKGFKDTYTNNIRLLRENEKMKEYIMSLVDYFETEKYIFVHSWLPLGRDDQGSSTYLNFREADKKNWESARWENPFLCWDYMNEWEEKTGKTIVFGHWHTAHAHARYNNDGVSRISYSSFEKGFNNCNIFYGKGTGADDIIALDACTVVSNQVNCLVIEDEPLKIIK